MIKSKLLILFVLLNFGLQGQMNGTFGNEWINFTQKYLKIKVAKDGIYVINYNNLSTSGITAAELSAIKPNNIQMFYRGIEIPIYVSAQGNNSFGSNDWIEFYGLKNDGKLDKPLFKKPDWQPQDYKSFYNDTSVYFLTWTTSTPGKRLVYYSKTDYNNYSPLSHFIQKDAITFNTYYDGMNYTQQLLYHQPSDFTEGEGYISATIWNKADVKIPFSIIDLYKNGSDVNFKTEIFGVRDSYRSQNGYSHHVKARVYKTVNKINTTLDSIFLYYLEYEHPNIEFNLSPNLLDTGINSMTAYFNIVNDLGILSDKNFLHKIEIEYPKLFKARKASQFAMFLPSVGLTDSYINFPDYGNGSKNNAYIYDFDNGYKVACTVVGSDLKVIIPGNNQERKVYIADSTDRISIASMSVTTFNKIDISSGTNYLIVSHKNFASSTIKYGKYRDSTSFKTQITWIDELYDQFCYGYNSPLAIRNYSNYMLQNNDVKPNYLLLIGKGIQTDFARALSNINFVPTWGVPGTDALLTAGLDGTTYESAIPTGRIPAVIDSQVLIYLTKVKIYEKDINTPALWKKSILHSGGGLDQFQTSGLKSQLQSLQSIAESDSFGAVTSEYYKFQTIPVTNSLEEAIREELKNGKSMTFYFGHGASDRMEIDMGDPQNAQNLNKLPVMMTAGCLLGNSYFASSPQMGEKWLFANKEKNNTIDAYGAVAWIGNSWYGYISQLGDYFHNFYSNAFNKNYGNTLGNIMKSAVIDNQDTSSVLIESHCKQVVLMGDPALKIYSPKYPEYLLANKFTAAGIPASLSMYPADITALSDSFAVKVTIYNQGKSTSDSIKVRVTRKFPDGRPIKTYDDITVLSPKFSTDVYFWIKSKDITTKGLNTFTVEVNPDRKVNENGAYSNNKMSIDYTIADNNASIIFPYQYSTVSNKNVTITVQAAASGINNYTFKCEVDTSYKFNSPALQSKIVTGSSVTNINFTLLDEDTIAYYVRVKLNDSIYKVWDYHTFTYIKNSLPGWAQIDYPQYAKALPDQIYMNDAERSYSFASMSSNTYYFYSVGVNRDPGRNFSARVFRKNNGENMAIVNGQVKTGWGIVAIDPTSEIPYMPSHRKQYISPSDVNGNSVKTPTPVYLFDSTAFGQKYIDEMSRFIDSIPTGYRVFVLKGENTGLNSFSTLDLQMFVKIGSNLAYLKKIKDEWPLNIKGFKGKSGSAYHITADTLDKSIPPDKQIVIISDQLGVKFTGGNLTSEKIGPSKTWEKLYIKSVNNDNLKDKFTYQIIPVDKYGNDVYVTNLQNLSSDSFDLTILDANIYPNLKVMAIYSDDSLRTPESLKYWIINYKGVPEGTVLINLDKKWLPKDTVNEGDSIKFAMPFKNISQFDFDSVMVNVTLTDFMNNQTVLYNEKVGGIKTGDTLFYKQSISTSGLFKTNKITITFNPNNAQPEQYLYNNTYNLNFYVRRDLENPLLDVTFDGVRIFDGDLVSCSPKIVITAIDENKNKLISDTSQLNVKLKYPDGKEEKINYSSAQVKFTPAESQQKKATVEFSPEKLADGEYTLYAQAIDAAGNKAGNQPYMIKFRVNNKPSITRFFPYPNPFTSKARFVFTITGEQPPQDIRIQIMTISGIVVKEIFKEDLGLIHIGNNTTDYAWDGTDQYGDKLANGVYLYKVTAKLNGKDIELVADDNEQYFKRGLGKIVIMR
jgi:hypothetical protein